MPAQPRPHTTRRILRLAIPALLGCAIALALLRSNAGHSVVLKEVRSTAAPRSVAHGGAYNRASISSSPRDLAMIVTPTSHGQAFPAGAVGLSVEADELGTLDLSATHSSLVTLMRQLGPGILRLGGNSLDYSWWTDHDDPTEPVPAWAKTVITPSDLSMLHQLLAATGWHAILGVDLGHFDPSRAANEAQIATRMLGSGLLGFEIGNEPNDYGNPLVKLRPSDYNVTNYVQEVAAYAATMQRVVNALRLFGPDVSSQTWLAEAADSGLPFVALTQHYYPTKYSIAQGACKATSVPSALELLSPQVRGQEDTLAEDLAKLGKLAHRETRLTETNTTASCDAAGGPETSPVFASALWSLDWALRAGSAGVAGLNFHGYFGRCRPSAFSPICAPDYADEARGLAGARPEYYGLFAARQLEGGYFVPVSVRGHPPQGDFSAYATLHPHHKITLAIDNFSVTAQVAVSLTVPGYHQANAELLMAPSLNATTGVTLGQASVSSNGSLHPTMTPVRRVSSTFRIRVPATSALIVELSA
jgi:hypothetical protein